MSSRFTMAGRQCCVPMSALDDQLVPDLVPATSIFPVISESEHAHRLNSALFRFLSATSSHLPIHTLYLSVPAIYMDKVPLTRSILPHPPPYAYIFPRHTSCYPYAIISNVPSQISALFHTLSFDCPTCMTIVCYSLYKNLTQR